MVQILKNTLTQDCVWPLGSRSPNMSGRKIASDRQHSHEAQKMLFRTAQLMFHAKVFTRLGQEDQIRSALFVLCKLSQGTLHV